MEIKLAETPVNAAPGRNLYAAAANLDEATGARRGQHSYVAESREGMAVTAAPVGGKSSRLRKPATASDRSKRSLAKIFRPKDIPAQDWRKAELSIGERYWIERLRNREDQHQAAKRYNLTRWQYQWTERTGTRDYQPMKVTHWEWCRVMRRRAGKLQREIADDLKLNRVSIHNMENGLANCDPLIWYWEQ